MNSSAQLKAEPHVTVLWGLSSWFISTRYLPLRVCNDNFLAGFTEAVMLVSIVDLLKRIELSLKEMLHSHLRKVHGHGWWVALPPEIQRNAANRHRWATAQIGSRRAGSLQNIAWLSMGDVIKSINTFDKEGWTTCLKAETYRKRQFEDALQSVKAFRDNQLAHPKPRPTTNHEIAVLCRAVQRLPGIVRPSEWNEVIKLLKEIKSLPPDDRTKFSSYAHSFSSQLPNELCEWLTHVELVQSPPTKCLKSISAAEAKWRQRVVKWCAELDAGGYVFFGRED
jgi:hypothetical protein